MANVVIDMQSGTVLEKAICPTSSTEPRGRETLNRTSCGVAEDTTKSATPDRSGQTLSEEEKLRIAKIRRDRRHGWMATFDDLDFLLEMLEKVGR